jgi:opacity protein-like surface antigen
MHSLIRVVVGVFVTPVLLIALVGPLYFPVQADAADTNWAGIPQVEIPFFSLGGRATYFDPKEGEDRWFGGAQVRVHPSHYFAVEGSADYRREEFDGGTKTHTFPVQGSLLIYPIGTTRLAPFILGGGGWYFTSIDGPGGFSDTQHRFGGHVGGGLQLFITNHISIDSTYRHIWLERVESKNVSLDDKKFNDNGHMVTIGMNVHF